MTTPDKYEGAEGQARAQYEGIVEMLAAVDCDYSRLEELKEEEKNLESDCASAQREYDDGNKSETWPELGAANAALSDWREENSKELEELESAAGDCEGQDDARERIQEDPLSVEVRSDWTTPGETLTPSEFMILLCTGGPAVRIRGELDEHLQPSRAWIEYQDWGTPWTQYYPASMDTLCAYAANFYFGE